MDKFLKDLRAFRANGWPEPEHDELFQKLEAVVKAHRFSGDSGPVRALPVPASPSLARKKEISTSDDRLLTAMYRMSVRASGGLSPRTGGPAASSPSPLRQQMAAAAAASSSQTAAKQQKSPPSSQRKGTFPSVSQSPPSSQRKLSLPGNVGSAAGPGAADVIKSGWLLKRKKKAGLSSPRWQRRYFVLNRNFLYYFYKQGDAAPRGFMDMQTTAVKPCAGVAGSAGGPHSFLVVSVAGSWLYRSASGDDAETREWERVLGEVSQRRLLKGMGLSRESTVMSAAADGDAATTIGSAWQSELKALLAMPGNSRCVDCAATKPEWASINLGVFVCLECSGIHRALGVHFSKVRSVRLDDWTGISLAPFQGGNEQANARWEAQLGDVVKPAADADASARSQFIRAKYVDRKFMRASKSTEENEAAEQSVEGAATTVAADEEKKPVAEESTDSDHDDNGQESGGSGDNVCDDTPSLYSPPQAKRKLSAAPTSSSTSSTDPQLALQKNKMLVIEVIKSIDVQLLAMRQACAQLETADQAIDLGKSLKAMTDQCQVLANVLGHSLPSPDKTGAGQTPAQDRLQRLRGVMVAKLDAFQAMFKVAKEHVASEIHSQEDLLVVLQPIYVVKRLLASLDL